MTIIIKIYIVFQFLLLFYFIISLINRRRLKILCDVSKYNISNLGTNIALIGATGDGKTTTAAGITNYLIEIIIDKCISRMEKIRKQLYFVNFNTIKNLYIQYLDLTNSFDFALLSVLSYIDKEDKMDLYSTDYISTDSAYYLIRDYILYFNIVNFNKNFVYSKGHFIDRVTGNVAALFDSTSIELRTVLSEKNFQIYPGLIIFDDEKSLERGNVFSNSKNVKLSGSKEFYALLRNMFKELTYHVSMKQISDDEVKQERLLINSSLMIFDRKDYISSFPLFRYIINIPFILVTKLLQGYYWGYDHLFNKKYKKLGPSFNIFKNSSSWYRIFEYYTYMISNILKSISYIRVRLYRYYRSDDVGSHTKDTFDRLILYFPTQYCYGCVDTYEYYYAAYPIFDSLRINSIHDTVSKFNVSPRIQRLKDIFKK